MRRLLTGLITVLFVSVMAAGCSLVPPIACTAIGWANTITVALEGAAQGVHTVELCIEGTCSVTVDQLQERSAEPLQIATAIPQNAQEAAPASAPPAVPPTGSRLDDGTWKFSLMMNAPKEVTVRALSADGAIIAEREAALTWKRVGGTEQCGGPSEAAPITLSIPGE